ncbi:hypothetical protein Areg01_41690 [Actinoplanes regularis]|nr:hypothetical protein Areg01_41690 [Actinoplanes regularis]
MAIYYFYWLDFAVKPMLRATDCVRVGSQASGGLDTDKNGNKLMGSDDESIRGSRFGIHGAEKLMRRSFIRQTIELAIALVADLNASSLVSV